MVGIEDEVGSAPPSEQAYRSLIRTTGLLRRVMKPHFGRFGVSGSQWGILRTLHRASINGEKHLRVTELGRRMLIQPPSVTGAVDRLVRIGYVRRMASATDRRVKEIALTPSGQKLVNRVLAVHRKQTARVMSGLSRAEQDRLHKLLTKLDEHLELLAADEPEVQSV